VLKRKRDVEIHFEVFGRSAPLMLGYPIMLDVDPSDLGAQALDGYLARLTDRYRVLVMAYPNRRENKTGSLPLLTADQVCHDLISIADAAGFERFAWWGFSWGGLVGLQLASRTDRVSALVCGAWPPLEGPHKDTLHAMRKLASDPPPGLSVSPRDFVPFYESVQDWSEADALKRITCPRMAFVGSDDEFELAGVKLRFAETIRKHQRDLEERGWHITQIPGRDHSVFADPATVVPIVRAFLDGAVLT
jgi:pimeloyl-ACP methyl ester carboxylesterase